MLWQKREKGKEPLATEIIYDLLEKITIYWIVLGISLAVNVILTAVLVFGQ